MIRVVDIESGVVWFTRKRFREFYKLHRKVRFISQGLSLLALSVRHVVPEVNTPSHSLSM